METNTFYDRLKAAAKPVLVYFYAPWCLPCRGMQPHLDRLATAHAGEVEFWKINADEASELARSLAIFGIPTLLLFDGSEVVTRKTGAQPAAALEALFEAVRDGGEVALTGISPVDRVLRGVAGMAVAVIGFATGPVWPVVVIGLAIGFTGVYDRCPIWQALTTRARKLIN
jgi:thioredoxin 1